MAKNQYKTYQNYDDVSEYAGGMIYGNVAYDLSSVPSEHEEVKSEEKKQVRTKTYDAEKPNQGVSLFAIIGFGLFALIMIFVLLARIQLTQVTDEAARLETKIQELSETEARLKIEYESAFNLTEIEEYATKKLGMVRSSDNVNFFQTTSVDRAEILEQDDKNSNFFEGFKDFINSLLEYF